MKNIFVAIASLLLTLSILFIQPLKAQEIESLQRIGGTFDDRVIAMHQLPNGDLILIGEFQETADLTPGPPVNNFISSGGTDFFITRIAANGTQSWINVYGSNGTDVVTDLAVSDNNIFVTGNFSAQINFNPATTEDIYNSVGSTDGFLLSLQLDGSFNYVAVAAGAAGDEMRSVAIDSNGDAVCAGTFYSSDLVLNDFLMQNSGGEDFFLARMNAQGEVSSAFNIGSPFGGSDTDIWEIAINSFNEVAIGGSFSGQQFDFDPLAGALNFSAGSSQDAFVALYSANNEIDWVRVFGNTGYEAVKSLAFQNDETIIAIGEFSNVVNVDPELPNLEAPNSASSFMISIANGFISNVPKSFVSTGNILTTELAIAANGTIYLGGKYSGIPDVDGSETIANLNNGSNIYIAKYDASLNLIYGTAFGNDDFPNLYDLILQENQDLLLCGGFFFTTTFQQEPSPVTITSAGGEDGFFANVSQDLCSNFSLTMFELAHPTCESEGLISFIPEGGAEPITIEWSEDPENDSFSQVLLVAGLQNVLVTDANGCTRQRSIVINGPLAGSNIDLVVNMSAESMVVGQTRRIFIDAYNALCEPTNGNIIFDLGESLEFVSSSVSNYTVEDNTVIWPFENLNFDDGHIQITLTVLVSPDTPVGDWIEYGVSIVDENESDIDTTNNSQVINALTTGSFDPNDKQVYPSGICTPRYTIQPETFTYTVRFQNLGNAAAQNIFIYDTLSMHLDPQSIVIRGFDPFLPIVEVIEGNILTFSFYEIYLPDSLSNPEESTGYVIFEIAPYNANLPDNTVIENNAAIVFDMNEPIITNTVLNTIVEEIPLVDNTFTQDTETSNFVATQDNANYTWYADCAFSETIADQTNQTLNLSDIPFVLSELALEINYMGCPSVFSDCVVLSEIKESSNETLEVSPNPVIDQLSIISESSEQAHYIIFDITGKQVMAGTLNNSTINVSTFPSGIYIIRIDERSVKFVKG